MDKDSKIAVWNSYHDMPEVLCIEDDDEWQEITLGKLAELVKSLLGDDE